MIINDASEDISLQYLSLMDCKYNTSTGDSGWYKFIYGNAPLLLPFESIPKNSDVTLQSVFK